MAKPNYQYEKRQKELEKKRKKEEKLKRKQERPAETEEGQEAVDGTPVDGAPAPEEE